MSALCPTDLKVRSARILLESLAVQADIGFHDFEVGAPQRLLVTVEIWLEDLDAARRRRSGARWNYDFLRTEVEEIAAARRYNLQETLAHAIFERVAAFRGVSALARPHCRSPTSIRRRTASALKSLPFPELGRS